jgi:hypothetical protein
MLCSPVPPFNGRTYRGTADGNLAASCVFVLCRLVTNLLIGSACMFGFLVFRTFMKQYQLRSVSGVAYVGIGGGVCLLLMCVCYMCVCVCVCVCGGGGSGGWGWG